MDDIEIEPGFWISGDSVECLVRAVSNIDPSTCVDVSGMTNAEHVRSIEKAVYGSARGGAIEDIFPSLDESPDELEDALVRARKRGSALVSLILDGDEFLSEDSAATLMDCSGEELVTARKSGHVLALCSEDGLYRYPIWQFSYDGQPFAEMASVIACFEGNSWAVYRFMKSTHPALGSVSGIDCMKMSRIPRLVAIAESWLAGDFQ